MAGIARENFRRNGLDVRLIVGDALGMRGLGRADILIGELLSTWCVVEPQVPVFRHLLSVLEVEPIAIPRRIVNYAQGVHAKFGDDEGLVVIPSCYFEFSETEKAESMTGKVRASETVFSREMALESGLRIVLRAEKDGVMNALRLTSRTEMCRGVWFGASDDTMPAIIFPLPAGIEVRKGQEIRITIEYEYGGGWEKFGVEKE